MAVILHSGKIDESHETLRIYQQIPALEVSVAKAAYDITIEHGMKSLLVSNAICERLLDSLP